MSKEARMVFENRIKQKISERFVGFQEEKILSIIDECLIGFNLEIGSVIEYSSEELLSSYLKALEIQGRSAKTIERYRYQIQKYMDWTDTAIQDTKTYNIRAYLGKEKERGLSNETLDGLRSIFSAYFKWLHGEGLITSNPIANLGPIKKRKKIKTVYTEIDMEKMKMRCKTLRDRAIICFLYATGCRISEMTQLNRDDVDLDLLECTVIGKGHKERTVYLDTVSAMVLQEYLDSRDDDNEALFVSNMSPHERLEPNGVRYMLKLLQDTSGVEHIHPHKFRRTRATNLVKHGMPIQEVAAVLGHEKIDTTMEYVIMDKTDIKNDYKKYF